MQYTESLLNLNKTGEINLEETQYQFFIVMKNLNYNKNIIGKGDQDHLQPIFLDEDIERYISIKFLQSSDNYYEQDDSQKFKREETRAKQCTPEDFSDDKETQAYISEWAGYSLFCIDKGLKAFML